MLFFSKIVSSTSVYALVFYLYIKNRCPKKIFFLQEKMMLKESQEQQQQKMRVFNAL